MLGPSGRLRVARAAASRGRRIPGLGRVARDADAALSHRQWVRDGAIPPPPPEVKQRIVRQHGKRWKLGRFVETGTYRGDMVAEVCDGFESVVSIELSEDLHRQAVARHSETTNVTLLQGDSAALLPTVIAELQEPALFWLDAHFSAGITARGVVDTPVKQELQMILSPDQPPHVVLIDDARLFDGTNDYPTLAELRQTMISLRPGWVCEVADDIIRIHPLRPTG
jgi:hypothetical protein